MMTSLVQVEKELMDLIGSDDRQLKMEEKRNRANKPRLQMLKETLTEHTVSVETVKNLVDKNFKNIFAQRYRDSTLVSRL